MFDRLQRRNNSHSEQLFTYKCSKFCVIKITLSFNFDRVYRKKIERYYFLKHGAYLTYANAGVLAQAHRFFCVL